VQWPFPVDAAQERAEKGDDDDGRARLAMEKQLLVATLRQMTVGKPVVLPFLSLYEA